MVLFISIQMTEKGSRKGLKKIITVVILAVVIASTLTIAFGASNQTQKLIAVGTAGTLIPNDVNTTLNVTLSDMNYITQPSQFAVYQGSYNVGKFTYSNTPNGNFLNDTYQIMNITSAATAGANDLLQYNVSTDKGNTSYFFTEARLAYNGTSGTQEYIVSSAKSLSVGTAGTGIAASNSTVALIITPGSSNTATVTLSYGNTTAVTTTSNLVSINQLTFYLFSIYVTKDNLTVGIYNTANGTVLGSKTIALDSSMKNTFYKDANVTAFEYASAITSPSTQAGLIFDWMYVATHNTYSSATAAVSPAIETNGLSPMVSGSSAFVNTGNSLAPFDPSSNTNTTYNQAPNVSAIHENTNVGGSDFSSVLASNNTTVTHAILLNTSSAVTNFTKNQSLNSTQGFQTFATDKQTNSVINANIHVSVWNSTGIKDAIISFLKNYSAIKATIDTGVNTNYTEITIMGYAIGSIQLATNLSSGDASAVRNYMDNNIAGLLKTNNLSLIDQNTSAIVAGAFAGDFYDNGMAIVPVISGGMIVNPITGQEYATPEAAGFAAGAFVSGGTVIVPQVSIVGFSGGIPVYAASGFSFGGLFSSISSAGKSVENYLSGGASSISNAIGKLGKRGADYVVKPITSAVTNAKKAATTSLTNFDNQVSSLSNSIMPAIGAIPGNVQHSVSNALGPIAGSVSKISDQLGSFKQGLITSVSSGYSGLKTSVLSLGKSTTSAIASLKNTVDSTVAQSQAVLSKMYTAMANIPGEIHSDVTSLAAGIYNSSKADFATLMNTAGSFYQKSVGKLVNVSQSTFGSIASKIASGIGSIKAGVGSAFSMITSFGAKLGYVLEIVGITIAAVVIIGLVLYFFVFKKNPVGVPGETSL